MLKHPNLKRITGNVPQKINGPIGKKTSPSIMRIHNVLINKTKFLEVDIVVGCQRIVSLGNLLPIGSMYGIFIYIWLKSMVNVGKYSLHGSYGL